MRSGASERSTESYKRSPSTTFGWRKVKIGRPPEGEQARRPKAVRRGSLARRNWFDPLTVTIAYSGGPEAWVVIKTRGREFRRPGHVQLIDVVRDINGR